MMQTSRRAAITVTSTVIPVTVNVPAVQLDIRRCRACRTCVRTNTLCSVSVSHG
jgi:hypothetical protein